MYTILTREIVEMKMDKNASLAQQVIPVSLLGAVWFIQ